MALAAALVRMAAAAAFEGVARAFAEVAAYFVGVAVDRRARRGGEAAFACDNAAAAAAQAAQAVATAGALDGVRGEGCFVA